MIEEHMCGKHQWSTDTIDEEDLVQYKTCERCGARGPRLTWAEHEELSLEREEE